MPAVFHGGINEVLLTGLVLALADWRRRRGGSGQVDHAVLIDLEGHGREELFADVDLSRTVGWFTSLFPVRLDPGALDSTRRWRAGRHWAARSRRSRSSCGRCPIMGSAMAAALSQSADGLAARRFAVPQIAFNYLGRFAAPAAADWAAAEGGALGLGGDPTMPLAHALEINALTLDAPEGPSLTATWSFAPPLLADDEVRALATGWFRALEALVRHAERPGAGGRSPSDLPLVELRQGEIEALEHRYPQIEDVLPLSPLQEGLLFHALYDAQAADVYTVELVLALQGALDHAALQAAVQALLARHASLRAAFRHQDLRRPVQVIVPRVEPPWRNLDLSLLDAASREARLAGILAEDRAERFDLAAPPLMRFALIRLAAAEHRLVLTHHHILMDGWSGPLLVQELLTLYAHKGNAAALPRLTAYRDYLAWIARQDRDAAVSAWREALAGLEEGTRLARLMPRARGGARADRAVAERTADRGADAVGAPRGRHARYPAPGRLGGPAGTPHWPRRRGVRRDGGGSAAGDRRHRAHGGAVHQHAAAARAAAGGEAAARSARGGAGAPVQPDGAPASGVGGDPSSSGPGGTVRHLGGVRELSVDRDGLAAVSSGDLRLADVSGHDATHYPVSLMAMPGEQLRLRLDYRPDLFDRAGARRWWTASSGCWRERSRTGPPDGPSRHSQRRRAPHLLHGWNETAPAIAPATLPALFAAQVARTPDAVAVVLADQRLTYAELDARANQLAHHLRTLGVGPETVVGLCVERSFELLVGLIGILKAGAAYLPLDPRYPAERLAYMLADAGAPVIVTQSTLLERLPATDARIVQLDADGPAIAAYPAPAPAIVLDPHNTAYVIYTSGSTGRPEGAVVPHRDVLRLFAPRRHRLEFGPETCGPDVPLAPVRLLGLGDLGSAGERREAGDGAAAVSLRPGGFH